MVLEPIFEREFAPGSFGFRPGRGCQGAIDRVEQLLAEGYTHVVDADLKSYFDTIPHERLLAWVKTKVVDGRILELVRCADDFVVLCRTREQAEEVLATVRQWTASVRFHYTRKRRGWSTCPSREDSTSSAITSNARANAGRGRRV